MSGFLAGLHSCMLDSGLQFAWLSVDSYPGLPVFLSVAREKSGTLKNTGRPEYEAS